MDALDNFPLNLVFGFLVMVANKEIVGHKLQIESTCHELRKEGVPCSAVLPACTCRPT